MGEDPDQRECEQHQAFKNYRDGFKAEALKHVERVAQ